MDAPGAAFELEGGRLHLRWAGLADCFDVGVRCRLADGHVYESADWRVAARNPDKALLETTCGPLSARVVLTVEGGRARARLAACAREATSVLELGLVTRVHVRSRVPGWLLYNGFGSWDAAGLAAVPAGGAALESWWNCGLADDSGVGLAVGAASATRVATTMNLHGSELAALHLAVDDALGRQALLWDAKPQTEWSGEDLLFAAASDVRDALAMISKADAPRPAQPRGWLSWYHFGPWVSEQDVVANAAQLKNGPFAGHGLDHVQIDDGWQQAWGDWRPNSKFGTDFGGLPAHLAADGFKSGVWTAPFLVAPDSDLSGRAPEEWFLRHPESGRRLVDPHEEHLRTFYVLDARLPAVQDHLTQVFADLRRLGFSYFKIDFLYAGAYAGVPALRAGVEAIRKGIGDAYLLACGAPLLPMVGLVDGCRIGIDTCSMLFDFEKGEPAAAYVDDEIRSIARNVAWRQPLEGWFQLDPDVALAGGNNTVDEARQLVTLVAISGGLFFLSDDLTKLAPERRSLLTNQHVLDLAGKAAARPDWEPKSDGTPPSVWRSRDGILAVFNWTSRDRQLCVPLHGARAARDLWTGCDLGLLDDPLKLVLPPAGVRLMRLGSA
jgi:alpha-galactosidase